MVSKDFVRDRRGKEVFDFSTFWHKNVLGIISDFIFHTVRRKKYNNLNLNRTNNYLKILMMQVCILIG